MSRKVFEGLKQSMLEAIAFAEGEMNNAKLRSSSIPQGLQQMSPNPNVPKIALSIREFCAAVGLGRSRAYEEIKAGRLKVLKCGRRTLIAKEAVAEWLERLATQNR